MMRIAAALAFLASLLFAMPARAASADEVLALTRDVCLAHGARLTAIADLARERGWRELSVAELEATRDPNALGYMTGWAVRDGDDPITLTMSLPAWTLTDAMRRRVDQGSTVLPPPEGSLRMFGGAVPTFPNQARLQFCDIKFAISPQGGEEVARNAWRLPFLDSIFGPPAVGADDLPVDGLLQPNGDRYWHWAQHRDPIWQRIQFNLGADGQSRLRITQNWVE